MTDFELHILWTFPYTGIDVLLDLYSFEPELFSFLDGSLFFKSSKAC